MAHAHNQWMSQDAIESRRLQRGRQQICRRSPFLTVNFNLPAHKQVMQAAKERLAYRKLVYHKEVIERRHAEQRRPFPVPPPPIRPAFGGKEFTTYHGAVLLYPTVFVPSFYKGRLPENISDWPSRNEMKYEGDDRISTDILHARFPPAPRVQGNGTVNWQQRTVIVPQVFDYFFTSPEEYDIFLRQHWIDDSEFNDEEGEEAVGKDLMKMIECEDIW